MWYMDKERAESRRRNQDHLAKLKTYQEYEKERTAIQREMSKQHAAAMKPIQAESLRRHKEYVKTHREYEMGLGKE